MSQSRHDAGNGRLEAGMGAPSPKYTAEFKQKVVEPYKKSGATLDEFADMLDAYLKWYRGVRPKIGLWANN